MKIEEVTGNESASKQSFRSARTFSKLWTGVRATCPPGCQFPSPRQRHTANDTNPPFVSTRPPPFPPPPSKERSVKSVERGGARLHSTCFTRPVSLFDGTVHWFRASSSPCLRQLVLDREAVSGSRLLTLVKIITEGGRG